MYRTTILNIFSVICLALVSNVAMAIDLDSPAVKKTQIECSSYRLNPSVFESFNDNSLSIQDVELSSTSRMNVRKVTFKDKPSQIEVIVEAPINKVYEPIFSYFAEVKPLYGDCLASGSFCEDVFSNEDLMLQMYTFSVNQETAETICVIYIGQEK